MSLPVSLYAKRIHALFKRKPTAHWAPKEIKALTKLAKSHCFDSLDDLTLVERYYFFERKKGDKGVHRRDLYTFLNNYIGEVDRAVLWAEKNPKLAYPSAKAESKAPDGAVEWDEEKAARGRQAMREVREKLRGPLNL